jgi:hypothetical protein
MKITKFQPKRLKQTNQTLKADLKKIKKQLSLLKRVKLLFKK